LAGAELAKERRPRKFTFVERYVSFDDERQNWREGFDHLASAGFNTLLVPPSAPLRRLLSEAGVSRVPQGVYSPPGYAFDYEPPLTREDVERWAAQQAAGYVGAGYNRRQMGLFVMSDEPGWNYPQVLQLIRKNSAAVQRFREYLRVRGLTAAEVGASGWDAVYPIGLSQAKDLPSRRLFYWSMRFFPWDSARYFA